MAGAAHVAMRKSNISLETSGKHVAGRILTPIPTVIVGRFLIGYAVGTITGVAPVFGAEIAKVSEPLHSA